MFEKAKRLTVITSVSMNTNIIIIVIIIIKRRDGSMSMKRKKHEGIIGERITNPIDHHRL